MRKYACVSADSQACTRQSQVNSIKFTYFLTRTVRMKLIFAWIFYFLIDVSLPLKCVWNSNLLWIWVSGSLLLLVNEGMQLSGNRGGCIISVLSVLIGPCLCKAAGNGE